MSHNLQWFADRIGKVIVNSKTKEPVKIESWIHARELHYIQLMTETKFEDLK